MAIGATAIRQAPGWWPSLCQAECDECGWHGPVRNCNDDSERRKLGQDKAEHHCGPEAAALGWTYKQTEPSLWTVGYYSASGQWEPESDHGSPEEAAGRVTELNDEE